MRTWWPSFLRTAQTRSWRPEVSLSKEVQVYKRMRAAGILGKDMVALISEDSSDEELETRGQPK